LIQFLKAAPSTREASRPPGLTVGSNIVSGSPANQENRRELLRDASDTNAAMRRTSSSRLAQNPNRAAGSSAFVLFLVAVLLWASSLFCLGEAIKMHDSLSGTGSGIVHAQAAGDTAQLLSFLFVLGWFGRNLFLSSPGESAFDHIENILIAPEQLTPGILLAVFPPVVIGAVKLMTAVGVRQEEGSGEVGRRNWLWVNLSYLSILLVLGIAAALLLYFQP